MAIAREPRAAQYQVQGPARFDRRNAPVNGMSGVRPPGSALRGRRYSIKRWLMVSGECGLKCPVNPVMENGLKQRWTSHVATQRFDGIGGLRACRL